MDTKDPTPTRPIRRYYLSAPAFIAFVDEVRARRGISLKELDRRVVSHYPHIPPGSTRRRMRDIRHRREVNLDFVERILFSLGYVPEVDFPVFAEALARTIEGLCDEAA
jgi:hypothetical protein